MSETTPLRLSDADREIVTDSLRAAFTEGRLDLNEFEDRVDLVTSARFEADLAAALEGLPPVRLPSASTGASRRSSTTGIDVRSDRRVRQSYGGFPIIRLAIVVGVVWMVFGGISSFFGWVLFALFLKFAVFGRRHRYAC